MTNFTILGLLIVQLTVIVLPCKSYSCTAFKVDQHNNPIVAKSYDWHHRHGFLMTNKRNVSKIALLLEQPGIPHRWKSIYGSITFNQYGREFPLGGINEAGLVIEALLLPDSSYPAPSYSKGALNELQWIQYNLDSFKSVDQVVRNSRKVIVTKFSSPIHYFVCDASSKCAVFEYIDKKLVITEKHNLPFPTIANSTYKDSYEELLTYIPFGGNRELSLTSRDSNTRFATATLASRNFGQTRDTENIFDILDSVRVEHSTKFQIVYDTFNKKIYYKTLAISNTIKTINIDHFDYSCSTPVKIFDLENPKSKSIINVTSLFIDYKMEINLDIITRALGPYDERTRKAVAMIAKYPEATCRCNEN